MKLFADVRRTLSLVHDIRPFHQAILEIEGLGTFPTQEIDGIQYTLEYDDYSYPVITTPDHGEVKPNNLDFNIYLVKTYDVDHVLLTARLTSKYDTYLELADMDIHDYVDSLLKLTDHLVNRKPSKKQTVDLYACNVDIVSETLDIMASIKYDALKDRLTERGSICLYRSYQGFEIECAIIDDIIVFKEDSGDMKLITNRYNFYNSDDDVSSYSFEYNLNNDLRIDYKPHVLARNLIDMFGAIRMLQTKRYLFKG